MPLNFLNNGYFAGTVGIGAGSTGAQLYVTSTNYEMLHLHQADANAGLIKFTNTDDTSGWYTGIAGTEKFIISRTADNSTPIITVEQGGNVGIGTDDPGARRLSVVKNTGITSGFNDITEFLDTTIGVGGSVSVNFGRENSNKNVGKITFKYSGDGSSDNSLNLGFFGADNLVTLLANGNLGIGDTDPTAKLQVAGTTTYNSDTIQALRVCDATDVSKGIHIGFDTTEDAGIIQAGDFGVVYKNLSLNPNAGNVGIGENNPVSELHISGSKEGNVALAVQNTNSSYSSQVRFLNSVGTEMSAITFVPSDNSLRFYNNGNDKMIISSAGAMQFNAYGAGVLVTDASGNITATTSPPVDGITFNNGATITNQINTDVDTGTETIASVAIATHDSAFFDFVIKKGLNVRSGTVYACHDGDTTPLVAFTETSTQDLGDTSDVTLSVDISGTDMRLRATTTSDNWSIKSLIRAI